jgi:hypothetical protein
MHCLNSSDIHVTKSSVLENVVQLTHEMIHAHNSKNHISGICDVAKCLHSVSFAY